MEISPQVEPIRHDILVRGKALHKEPEYFLADSISLAKVKDEPLDP